MPSTPTPNRNPICVDTSTFAARPRRNARISANYAGHFNDRDLSYYNHLRGTGAGRREPRTNGAMLRLTLQTRDEAKADVAVMKAAEEAYIAKRLGTRDIYDERWAQTVRSEVGQAGPITVHAWLYRDLDRLFGIDAVASTLAGGALYAFGRLPVDEACGWVEQAAKVDIQRRATDDAAIAALRRVAQV